MTIPMTVCVCWHGDRCPWFQRGQCWFRHEGLPPKPSPPSPYHDDLQELREGYNKLREAVGKLAAAVMWRHHQRVEQACPVDNVALNIESLDKNYTHDLALAGRLEQGVVTPGGEVVSLPIHTASNPSHRESVPCGNASSAN